MSREAASYGDGELNHQSIADHSKGTGFYPECYEKP